jgi:hypothetical protein
MRVSSFGLVVAIVITAAATSGCKPLDRGTYQTCSASADCSSLSDSCILVMSTSSDRFCSRPCVTGSDCPSSRDGTSFGVCLPVASGDTVCYSHCSLDADCPVGWICNTGTTRGAACTPR